MGRGKHAPEGNFGCIVNFRIIMEHIYHMIYDADCFKQLQLFYKLKLATIYEVLLLSSFETTTPRFLPLSGVHSVVDNHSSLFTHISSFAKLGQPKYWFQVWIEDRTGNLQKNTHDYQ